MMLFKNKGERGLPGLPGAPGQQVSYLHSFMTGNLLATLLNFAE